MQSRFSRAVSQSLLVSPHHSRSGIGSGTNISAEIGGSESSVETASSPSESQLLTPQSTVASPLHPSPAHFNPSTAPFSLSHLHREEHYRSNSNINTLKSSLRGSSASATNDTRSVATDEAYESEDDVDPQQASAHVRVKVEEEEDELMSEDETDFRNTSGVRPFPQRYHGPASSDLSKTLRRNEAGPKSLLCLLEI